MKNSLSNRTGMKFPIVLQRCLMLDSFSTQFNKNPRDDTKDLKPSSA
jgi:hypothetical protein